MAWAVAHAHCRGRHVTGEALACALGIVTIVVVQL
jgi:hypothetical protein